VASSHLQRKLLISAVAGVAAGAVPVLLGAGELAPLVGWVVGGFVFLIWAWARNWRANARTTSEVAQDEERSRRSVDGIVVGATLVSFVAVVFALIRSSGHADAISVSAAILAVLAVVVSWALVNTVFAFRLARLYYRDDRHEFRFDGSDEPTYSDFAYAAFTVGMAYTFEVTISSTPMRRVALVHALLAYAYGTGVIAVAINLVTSIGQSGS
jgi:uncharacterized membrane protein